MSLERAYQAPGAAERYQQRRWSERAHARRADRREQSIVAGLLSRCGCMRAILDVPCGTGRFQPLLSRAAPLCLACDRTAAMLRLAPASRRLQAAAERLPLRDSAVDLAFCMRLLHHLQQPQLRIAVLRELARVSRRHAIASWYDRASLPAWRQRVRGRARARFPIARRQFEREAQTAGWRVIAQRYLARGLSEQVIALLERS
ncbi:MAG: class I SAM-dependent methyltransferase [Planctomycetota bacterium]|nr:MAG: class I SAM-dependent methyltransferase [Planctomycetota bacterium]